ncbi:MbtH family NRPS accessory protein [Fluviispira multicolorata]|uniref:MbtH family NRPS accessory protein n=2 Tax=Fluviispira multicolorata TaxID=2654512 RepID=A0A833JDE9_9BACT|nr:MbtH family NRPS accessory protein [Fluviispira multicolorata]
MNPVLTHKVVINHEEQYSLWDITRENPQGWTDVGFTGTKEECLNFIKEVWVDMRPLSLRKHIEKSHL